MRRAGRAPGADLFFDERITSHMSAGMSLYVRKFADLLPRVAPDLCLARGGRGDNFDAAEQLGLPMAIARTRPRLVHLPTPFVPRVVPAPYVLTIHDLIDLHYPQFGKRKVGPYYRFVVGPVARAARAVITDDPATVADLERFLRVDPRRVRVVPLGVDVADGGPSHLANGVPYFLYVGNHRPHKNVATLVDAWAALPAALAADLVVTGHPTEAGGYADRTRSNGKLVFLGACSDAELTAYYRAARAYVHPALREGFGLPLLEAMQAGAPVIAARSALPEVLAPHAVAFEATDTGALRGLLESALVDPAPFHARARAAQAAAHAFTWRRTVEATAAIYREFLA